MKVQQIYAFLVLLMLCTLSHAMPTSDAEVLPWDEPLTLLVASITGPFAFAVASVGMVTTGAILVFGNDLNRFGQSVMYLILVIGLIVLGVNGLAALFTTGAVIGSSGTAYAIGTAVLIALSSLLTAMQVVAVRCIKALLAKEQDKKRAWHVSAH